MQNCFNIQKALRFYPWKTYYGHEQFTLPTDGFEYGKFTVMFASKTAFD